MFLYTIVFTISLSGVVCSSSVIGDTAKNSTTYIKLFRDDFNDDQLNAAHWTATNVTVFSALHGFYDTQEFRAKNVHIRDGCLILDSPNERDNSSKGLSTESGRVDTRGKFAFRYGEVEVRARVPKGAMILHYPAVWLWDQDALVVKRGPRFWEHPTAPERPAISVLNMREDSNSGAPQASEIKVSF